MARLSEAYIIFMMILLQGWVQPESNRLIRHTVAGNHKLEAVLRVTEPFGWGLIVTLGGGKVDLLPVE
jgi:hypothetical protein